MKSFKAFCLLFIVGLANTVSASPDVMYAHYIDVGQADATLLEFPCGTILIDAGAQDDQHSDALIKYLSDVFSNKPHLNNTINSIIITHNHIDHTKALKKVIQNFTVQNYIDNGQTSGTGTGNPNWLRRTASQDYPNTSISEIEDSSITALPNKEGLTNQHIDPINCDDIDPEIKILSGRLDENPGWPHKEFDNKNNHSLVVRVDFGESSFLFTGDLEEDAIDTLLEYYSDTEMLDVDIYQVGHHGSDNATNKDLLEAMTPDIAVISMGAWDYGKNGRNRFTTWWYGHPRKSVIEQLELSIKRKRSRPASVAIAEGAKHFSPYTIKKAVYGTGWYGNVKVRAKSDGKFRVTTNQ